MNTNKVTKNTGDDAKQSNVEMSQDRPVYVPPTDIYELKDKIIVESDMPGVSEKNIDVTLEDDVLTLTGRQCECEPDGMELLHRGYAPGIFRRSFTLLTDIDVGKIKATAKHGILKVELPKSEKAKPRKITVKAG